MLDRESARKHFAEDILPWCYSDARLWTIGDDGPDEVVITADEADAMGIACLILSDACCDRLESHMACVPAVEVDGTAKECGPDRYGDLFGQPAVPVSSVVPLFGESNRTGCYTSWKSEELYLLEDGTFKGSMVWECVMTYDDGAEEDRVRVRTRGDIDLSTCDLIVRSDSSLDALRVARIEHMEHLMHKA